ncbi:MAG: sigma-54-dependent Fis family transcriptional regulator [Acidobacteria bacterium]|nr:sigma-54-dependent Fis family transcriptional regulator [Acidobacteriota bacterium]
MNRNHQILIVDDEANQRRLLEEFLQDLGYTTFQANGVVQARAVLNTETIDLVLSDYKLGDGTGEEILDDIQKNNPLVQFILFTAYGSIRRAVEFMSKGAADYLAKPLDLDELEIKIRNILRQKTILEENIQLRQTLAQPKEAMPIIHKSRVMAELLNLAMRSAQSNASVLITGESGTGKEMLARAIHDASPRHEGPFIAVNCTALNENLLESELFGHEKGSFTGADRQRIGRFEEAQSGTLFVDEIGEISPALQVKLLRVLQEKSIQRIGSNVIIPVDFRLIAATNRHLEEMLTNGTFRTDLYYRLNVIRLHIPPLRDRKEDIPLLVDRFIERYARENRRPIEGIRRDALHLLMRHAYPGNIRELENLIERAVVLSRSNLLQPEDFPELYPGGQASEISRLRELPLPEALEYLERLRIKEALEQADSVQIRAAELLGINERNLRYKMEKYGIPPRRHK